MSGSVGTTKQIAAGQKFLRDNECQDAVKTKAPMSKEFLGHGGQIKALTGSRLFSL